MRLIGHVLDYMLDHVLNQIIIGLVIIALQFYSLLEKYLEINVFLNLITRK